MAVIPVAPIVLKDCAFIVDGDQFEAHVSSVKFTPSTSQVSWQGMTPTATFTDHTGVTWVCELEYAQDWQTPNSLSLFLYANQGEVKACGFAPKVGGISWNAALIIAPGPIGGAVNQFATASVTMGVNGRPLPAA